MDHDGTVTRTHSLQWGHIRPNEHLFFMLSGSLPPCLVLEPLLNYCCYCTYHVYVTADSIKSCCTFGQCHFFYSLHFDQCYTGGSGGMATAQIQGPKPYTVGGDFALWVRRFEAYARTVKIPNAQMCDALLALLDDDTFRVFDLLQLPTATVADYKRLVEALKSRFAPTAGEAELRFQLGRQCQQPTQTLDQFTDLLVDLTNRTYPEIDPGVRMSLARDRFIAGVYSDYIQESLLEKAPETLDKAREIAKRLEAARTARKQIQTSKTAVRSVEINMSDETTTDTEVTAMTQPDSLLEAVKNWVDITSSSMHILVAIYNVCMAPTRSGSPPRCRASHLFILRHTW